jgi:hypothetical protein
MQTVAARYFSAAVAAPAKAAGSAAAASASTAAVATYKRLPGTKRMLNERNLGEMLANLRALTSGPLPPRPEPLERIFRKTNGATDFNAALRGIRIAKQSKVRFTPQTSNTFVAASVRSGQASQAVDAIVGGEVGMELTDSGAARLFAAAREAKDAELLKKVYETVMHTRRVPLGKHSMLEGVRAAVALGAPRAAVRVYLAGAANAGFYPAAAVELLAHVSTIEKLEAVLTNSDILAVEKEVVTPALAAKPGSAAPAAAKPAAAAAASADKKGPKGTSLAPKLNELGAKIKAQTDAFKSRATAAAEAKKAAAAAAPAPAAAAPAPAADDKAAAPAAPAAAKQ